MNTKQKRSTAINIVVFLAFTYACIRFADLEKISKTLDTVNLPYIPLLALLYIAFTLSNGYVNNKLALKSFDIEIKFTEWFGLSTVNTLANLVFPMKTGTLIKAAYLKNKYQFDISRSAGILVFSSIISLITLLAMSSSVLAYLVISGNSRDMAPWLDTLPSNFSTILFTITFIATITGCATLAYCLLSHSINGNHKRGPSHLIFNMVIALRNSIGHLSRFPSLIIAIIANSIVTLGINIAILYFAFLSINVHTDIFGLTCINLLNSISFYISLTPGNVGFQEMIVSLSSLILGVSFEEGLVVAALIRAASTIVTVILGSIYGIKLSIVQNLKP